MDNLAIWFFFIQGKIYASGGFGVSKSILQTMECYDPSTNKWAKMPQMKKMCGLNKFSFFTFRVFTILVKKKKDRLFLFKTNSCYYFAEINLYENKISIH